MAVLVLLCRKDLADAVLLETPETPGRVRHTVRIKPLIDDRPTKKRRKRRKRHPPTVRQAAHRTPRDEHGSNDSAPQQHAGLARIRRGVNAGWKRDKCMHACSQQCMHACSQQCMHACSQQWTGQPVQYLSFSCSSGCCCCCCCCRSVCIEATAGGVSFGSAGWPIFPPVYWEHSRLTDIAIDMFASLSTAASRSTTPGITSCDTTQCDVLQQVLQQVL